MASEVIALCQSFEQELNKTLSILPAVSASKPEAHDAHLNHHRLSQRVAESVSYYAGRLPAYASVPRILAFGDRLFRHEQHQLALQACYKHVRALSLHTTQEKLPRMDDMVRLSSHVQACFGCAACEAALLLLTDPQIKHPDTLQWLESCLSQLRAAIALALPMEQLYWLVVNGSVHVYTTAKAMITAGFAEQALPALIFCIKAIEGHICFAAPKYLPWRTQLYTWAVYGLIDCKATDQARLLLTDGLKRIDQLVGLQKLDPVPAAPHVQAAYSTTRSTLLGLQLRVEAAAGSSVTAVLSQLQANAAAAPGGSSGGAGPGSALSAASTLRLLAGMVEALHVPHRRVVRTEPADAALQELFDAATAAAVPLVEGLRKAVDQVAAAAAAAEQEVEADPTAAAAAAAGLRSAQDAFTYTLHKGLLCAAYNLQQWPNFDQLADLAVARTSGSAASVAGDADQSAAQLTTTASLLLALRQLTTQTGVGALRNLAAAINQALARGLRPSHGGVAAATATLPAVTTITAAATTGRDPLAGTAGGGSTTPRGPAAVHQAHLAPWQQLRDLLADASLALYGSARPLIDGVFCADDKEAGTVAELLGACHAAWTAVDLDDGELRVGAALKLALLLEQGGQLGQAKEILLQAKSVVQRVRSELMTANRRGADEHLRWITASRSQPSDETAALVAGMTPSEQELACLHVDVLALLTRVELALGVADQQGRATTRRTRVLEEQAQRTAQSSIFGARNATELARDEARLAAASATTPNPQMKERELLQACAKNPYERALVLIQMTAFQGGDTVKKAQLLQEAADLLAKAQVAEDSLFAAAQPDLRLRRDAPPQPKILQRTPTSVTLVAHPPGPGLKNLPGARKPPSCYVAYCKAFGAGVGLSMNKTASEYPGSGVRVPLGQSVTIEGLRTNDTYLFAVALYDDAGTLVGGLGTSTPEVILALPLPLYMCWAHLLAAAVRAGVWPAAKRAAGVLLPHFVVTTPDVPLWRANPMDAQRLHRAHVAAAARPLLRAVVQCIYVYGGAALLGARSTASTAAVAAPSGASTSPAAPVPTVVLPCTLPQLRTSFIEDQVARLKAARLLVLGMEVSALLPDEPLMQEGALRTYQLLAPLLALRAPRSTLLHKALSACHVVLSSLTNLVQESLYRQEHQRALAARVAAAVSYHLLRLSDNAGEGSASAHFGKLQVELLKAYDPRFTIPGRPPPDSPELQDEASRLHDVMLQHPRLQEWTPEPVVERFKDGEDLVARVLPIVATAAPMDAWGAALGFEKAAEHPRWVELVVRMLEAAVRRGNPGNAAAVAEQLRWWVRAKSKIPPREGMEEPPAPGTPPPPPPPKWSLEEAAAALTPAQLAGFQPLPAPPADGLPPDDAAALLQRHADEARAAEEAFRRRVAAVLLLQRRLPKLLVRKRAIDKIRDNLRRWGPWLARFNIVLGLVSAADARRWVQNSAARAAAAAAPAPVTNDAAATAAAAAAPSPDGDEATPPPGFMTPPLQAMMYLARAAQLAARSGAWAELANAARHAWNLTQTVLNVDPSLTAAVPRVSWERGLLPEPLPPPESILVPATPAVPDKKGGKKGGKEEKEKKKEAKTPATPKASRKKGAAAEEAPPPPRTYPLVVGSRHNMSRVVRSLVEAVMELASRLRDGLQLHSWVLPLGAAQGGAGGVGLGGGEAGDRPASGAVSDSQFSYGSDLQVDIWFKEGPLDLAWVSRLMGVTAVVLSRGERWHCLVELGRHWARLSEGAFNEKMMPWLLQAAPKAGVDPAPFQTALDNLIRDKNQALDQLDKVRTLVRERLGETALMSQGMGHKVRKKRRAPGAAAGGEGRPGTGGGGGGGGLPDSDRASMVSAAYTYRTASTYKTKASQPDFLRIPAEYEKVIEVLKRRNEKAAMVLAMHELGDVHAHFGNWGGAATAWNDTLDTLLGPYQAIKNWRAKLEPMSPAATLQAYGLHGLLLGTILAGKLARYTHHDNLHLRLEACRLAARLVFCAFSAHLGHPQRPLGFASYTPRELWAAGTDPWVLWSDPYRCPVVDLAGAMETVVLGLLDNGFALEALPVVALWEHVARDVMRNLHRTVLCRIMRCRALAALGLLAEGLSVAGGLMAAAGLPDPTLDSDYVLKDTEGEVVKLDPAPPFDNALLPGDPAGNKAALTWLGDTQLPPAVERLYGSWLVAHLTLARAQLLMVAGGVPNQWRATNWRTGERVEVPKPITPAPRGKAASAAAAAAAAAAPPPDTVGVGLPEVVEPAMLERANTLLRKALVMARGEDQPPVDSPASKGRSPITSAKGSKTPPRTPSPPKTPGSRGRSKSPITSAKGAAAVAAAGSAAAAAAAAAVAAAAAAFTADTSPPAPPPATSGQRAEVMVRTLLLLSELEQLRWHPARGLGHALEAARFLGSEADSVNLPQQGDNDALERYSLLPVVWFMVRGAAVRCAAQLGHGAHVHSLVEGAAAREAPGMQEQLHVVGMSHMDALVLAQEGRTAQALEGLMAVAGRYRALSVSDCRLAAALLDAASLRDRMGLHAEASTLAGQGLAVVEAHCMALGLGEAIEAKELTNVYADGTALYTHALGMAAVHASRRQQHAEAERLAMRAMRLLRQHTRGLPAQHAAALLTLGRMSRLVALCGEGEPAITGTDTGAGADGTASPRAGTMRHTTGVAATAAKLSAARGALTAAITLSSLDGGHLRTLIRTALLELASIYIAGLDARSAGACLRAAHAATLKQDLVLLSSHVLTPVSVGQLPEWATTFVKGQEARFAKAAGRNPEAAVPDTDVARMVICHLAGLLRSLDTGLLPVSGGMRACGEAKVAALHAALRYACAKYGMDACFADPPVPPSPPDAVPPQPDGTVLVQWHCQDGCWQEPRSWVADGALPAPAGASPLVPPAPTESQLLGLEPVDSYASLLYVVAVPSNSGTIGPQCGEVTFSVRAVRELQRRVKQLRSRMEKPKAPTDILGYVAPTVGELHDLLRAAEQLLSAIPRQSEDGSSSAVLTRVDSSLSAGADEVPMVGEVRPTLDVAFLCKLEALLNVESGLEVTDATLGAWLVQTLPALM